MIAEIIAIGSELTSGAKLDTNSQWLSRQLAAVGIPVQFHSTVADDLPLIVAVLRAAVDRSDLVIISGGLGPTLDDLTRQAMAELLGVELELHGPSLEYITAFFASRNRTMPERNRIQAMFPVGSEPISNPRGTAPGIWVEVPRHPAGTICRLAAVPGVPSEMRRMFQQEILPRLPVGAHVIRDARIHCFGIGESHAEQLLGELTARGRDPEIGITVHEATITLRIIAHGDTCEQCDAKLEIARQEIRHRLRTLVFGEEDEELEHVVVRMLKERGRTLCTAESGTGGLLAHRLTDVDGFDACYIGGTVAPTDTAKRTLLDVDDALLREYGAISSEAAAAMAAGSRAQCGTDFALAITECPQYDPENLTSTNPAAYVALSGADLSVVREVSLLGDPAINKSRTAKTALNMLRLHLLGEQL